MTPKQCGATVQVGGSILNDIWKEIFGDKMKITVVVMSASLLKVVTG